MKIWVMNEQWNKEWWIAYRIEDTVVSKSVWTLTAQLNMYEFHCINYKISHQGPYLAPSTIDFVHRRLYHSYFAPDAQRTCSPQTHVGKLGNELALPGAVQRKEEACSGANVPWCYFAVSENNSATDQEKPHLKSVARSDAILKAHAWP